MNPVLTNVPFGRHIVWRLPIAYVEADLEGKLTFVNEEACLLQELSAEQLVGRSIWEFLPRDEVANTKREFYQGVESGQDLPIIRRSIYSHAGEFRTHELHRRLLWDDAGTVVGICMAIFDVSEAEHAHREERQAKSWLESVVQAIPKALIVTDALGFVRYINPAAEELVGRPAADMVGRQVEKCLPILHTYTEVQVPLSFRMALHKPWSGLVDIVNAANDSIVVQLSASPILEVGTELTTGVVILFERQEAPAWTAL
jgi:PAS domain S-box-containing protein